MQDGGYLKKKTFKDYVVVILLVSIILASILPGNVILFADTLKDAAESDRYDSEEGKDGFQLTSSVFYPDYITEKEKEGFKNYTGGNSECDITNINLPNGKEKDDYLKSPYIAQESNEEFDCALEWLGSDLEWVEFIIDAPESAFYNIEISYYTPQSSIQTPQRSFNIDLGAKDEFGKDIGGAFFKESITIDFPRRWQDVSYGMGEEGNKYNTIGNQIRPRQNQIYGLRDVRIEDRGGKYPMPLRFAFTKGEHTIRFYFQYEPIVIKSIKLVAPEQIPTYDQKLSEWKEAGYKGVAGSYKIEAEEALYKSVPSLRKDGSSDPVASPSYEKGSSRLNVIGTTWSGSNQTLTWETPEIKEAGLYKIVLRAYARYSDGLPVYRRIKVNGQVPFKEFECYKIKFDEWNCFALEKEDGTPLLVYLDKGVNYLEMTVKFGEMSDIMNALERDSNVFSEIIRDITKLVRTNDPNFEYRLDEKIPDLIDRLEGLIKSYGEQIDRISALSEKRPSAVNNFVNMKEMLERLVADPDIIPRNYNELVKAMANLGIWINEFGKMPMQLDYIEFINPDADVEVKKSTFFQKLGAAITAFIISFSKDYNSIGGLEGITNEDTEFIDIWISRGKEWAELLKQQSDESFFPEYNISVNFNILPSGQLNASATNVLLLALASGTGPDAAMGVAANLPVEYGMRGGIYALSNFTDLKDVKDLNFKYPEKYKTFDEVKERFLEGIMIPFFFGDEYYALPETMDFQCLYYRKDIIDDLNLEVPETWNDVYSKVLPALSGNGMEFNYLGGYNPFLFQNGGEYYMEDGTKSAWDSQEAIAGFKQWTDLYTVYDIPTAADFYNRFRSGQMPLGVSGFADYIKFVSAAPEITGKWGVAPIPGTPQINDDGETIINRSSGGATTACVILGDSTKKEAAWYFLDWYTDAETQIEYANTIKMIIGQEAIWASANVEAFDKLPWDTELREVIKEYHKWYKDPPNVVGGYITARYLENSRVDVVIGKKPYRPSLERSVKEINRELDVKNDEFRKRAEYEAKKKENSKENK